MNESKLKTRSAAKDIVLTILTVGVWGLWVLLSLHKNVSIIENECDIKAKSQLEPFDVFLIVVYGVLFTFSTSSTSFSGFSNILPVLAGGVIWITARHIRRRILKIAEIENYKSGYMALVGFSWVALIFFAFTLAIAPYVTLYRTIRMYNQLAENYNE